MIVCGVCEENIVEGVDVMAMLIEKCCDLNSEYPLMKWSVDRANGVIVSPTKEEERLMIEENEYLDDGKLRFLTFAWARDVDTEDIDMGGEEDDNV